MIPGKPWMFMLALPFFSFGIGGLFTLMMSMTADVCDLDELATGKRREGIFGAIYWWMVKLGFAVAGLLSGAIMSFVSFTPGAAVQPEGAVDGLRLFYSGIPILGTLVAMWIMRNYDLDEQRATQVHDELQRRKQPTGSGASIGAGGRAANGDDVLGAAAQPPSPLDTLTPSQMGAQVSLTLRNRVHGLCFSPYAEGQATGDALSEAQISRRLNIVAPHTRWVRSFSCTEGHDMIPKLARERGLKTLVGAWISHDKERNEREIEALLTLAQQGWVDIAAVGNEVMLRADLSEQELLSCIQRVKAALPSHVPVGCVDAYNQFVERPALTHSCDVLLANCYPFWEGVGIGRAQQVLQRMHGMVSGVAGGRRVIIAETGWPSAGQTVSAAVPSAPNAMRYFIEAQAWAQRDAVELFYFSSFDEPWKLQQEGEVGAQWGLWDKAERPKFGG
jgi:GPH family glycoside/pentoside/hexuronide:cation symporter